MANKEFRLISSTYLNGMRVEKGDILREIATKKTVKVLNVYKNEAGEIHLQANTTLQEVLDYLFRSLLMASNSSDNQKELKSLTSSNI